VSNSEVFHLTDEFDERNGFLFVILGLISLSKRVLQEAEKLPDRPVEEIESDSPLPRDMLR